MGANSKRKHFLKFFRETQIRTNFNINYYLATLSNNLSKQSWVLLDLILSKNGQFMKNSNHRKLSTDYRQNLRSYQNLTVIQMALKKLHLAPWIRWYPWTERASADLSLWAANDIHFQTTIINDEIVHHFDENWLPIYGSSSFRRYLTPLWSYCHRLRVNFHHSRARFHHWWWWWFDMSFIP